MVLGKREAPLNEDDASLEDWLLFTSPPEDPGVNLYPKNLQVCDRLLTGPSTQQVTRLLLSRSCKANHAERFRQKR